MSDEVASVMAHRIGYGIFNAECIAANGSLSIHSGEEDLSLRAFSSSLNMSGLANATAKQTKEKAMTIAIVPI